MENLVINQNILNAVASITRQRVREDGPHIDGSRMDKALQGQEPRPSTGQISENPEITEKAARISKQYGLLGFQPGESISDSQYKDELANCGQALADLTNALQIPSHGVALNRLGNLAKGKRWPLSIAVAARGHGGRSSAAAHYEGDSITEDGILSPIINLTKEHGCGCLAHEWGHYLDHTLALAFRNGIEPGITRPFASHGDSAETMPDEIAGALKTLMDVIRKRSERREIIFHIKGSGECEIRKHYLNVDVESKFFQNAQKADGNKKRKSSRQSGVMEPYWSCKRELFARAFESWVQDALGAKGKRSPYLVTENTQQSNYPQGNERININHAFDTFFGNLREWKCLD